MSGTGGSPSACQEVVVVVLDEPKPLLLRAAGKGVFEDGPTKHEHAWPTIGHLPLDGDVPTVSHHGEHRLAVLMNGMTELLVHVRLAVLPAGGPLELGHHREGDIRLDVHLGFRLPADLRPARG